MIDPINGINEIRIHHPDLLISCKRLTSTASPSINNIKVEILNIVSSRSPVIIDMMSCPSTKY